MIRENRTYLFEYQQRQKPSPKDDETLLIDFSENSQQQQLIDVHKKQVRSTSSLPFSTFVSLKILYNAETIGGLEQEKEQWRLEYQLMKIKFEKMRDDLLKEIDALKEKTNDNGTSDEQLEQLISIDQRDRHRSSDPPSERESMIKQHYSHKIAELETKLQLANGKGIAFYNEVKRRSTVRSFVSSN